MVGTATWPNELLYNLSMSHALSMVEELGRTIQWDNVMLRDLHHLLILPLYHGTVGTATSTDESLNHLLISHPLSMIEELGFIIEWDNAMLRTSRSVDHPTLPRLALPRDLIKMPSIFC